MSYCVFFFFFFFQAEDGIRDLTVTGVQTCALPICVARTVSSTLLVSDATPVARSSRNVVPAGIVTSRTTVRGGAGATAAVAVAFAANAVSTADFSPPAQAALTAAIETRASKFLTHPSSCVWRSDALRRPFRHEILAALTVLVEESTKGPSARATMRERCLPGRIGRYF